MAKPDWRGFDKIPASGGYVLVANHLSHLDPFLLSHALVNHGVTPRFLAKDTAFEYPLLGWAVKRADLVKVYRGTVGAADALRDAVAAVEQGKEIVIYPEGTLTHDPDNWPMTGRTGAVRIALTTGAPLVPVMQWGANEILPPYSKRPHFLPRKTNHVWVGDPVDLSPWQGKQLSEDMLHEATEHVMDVITAMVEEVRGVKQLTPRFEVRSLEARRTNYKEQTDG